MKKLDKIWPSFLFQTHFAGDLYTSSKKLSTTYYTFVINEWSIQHQQKNSLKKSNEMFSLNFKHCDLVNTSRFSLTNLIISASLVPNGQETI